MRNQKQKRNRWLNIFLAITLMIAMLVPVSAFAEEGDAEEIKHVTLHANNEQAYFEVWNSEKGEYDKLADSIIDVRDVFYPDSPIRAEGAKIALLGWSLSADGSLINFDEYVPEDGDNLYAIWSEKLDITLHANNEAAYYDGQWNPETNEYLHDTDCNVEYMKDDPNQFWQYLSQPRLEENAKIIFAGWSKEPDGDLIDVYNYVPQDGDELYAIWKKAVHVTVHANSDHAYYLDNYYNEETQDFGHLEKCEMSVSPEEWFYPTEPIREDGAKIVFSGFSLTENGDLIDFENYTPQDGDQIYAIWKNAVSVTYYANHEQAYLGESWNNETGQMERYSEDVSIVDPDQHDGWPVPSIDDSAKKVFGGWSKTPGGEPLDMEQYVPEDEDKLYAVWLEGVYVTLHLENKEAYFEEDMEEFGLDSSMQEMTVVMEKGGSFWSDTREPYNPLNKGVFQGWSKQKDGEPISDYIVLENDIELYAIWGDAIDNSEDETAANTVAAAISGFPDIAKLTLNDKAKVLAAKKAYDSLTTSQKAKVSAENITKLNAAVAKIEQIQKAADKAAADKAAADKAAAQKLASYNAAKSKAQALKVTKQKAKSKAKKKIKVTWKSASGAAGYQIQYGLKKNFKKAKTVTVKGAKKKSATLKKLKAGKKYYVRIRPYSTVTNTSGKAETVYGTWSKTMKIKAKK